MKTYIFILSVTITIIMTSMSIHNSASAEDAQDARVAVEGDLLYFEPIARLNGEQTAKRIRKILSEGDYENGWNGRRHTFKAGYEPEDQEKRQALFDKWQSGEGFEWFDPLWGDSLLDPYIKLHFDSCETFEADPDVYEEGSSVRKKAFRFYPHLGPVALFNVDKVVSADNKSGRRFIFVTVFNVTQTNQFDQIADGEPIKIGRDISRPLSYLFDLEHCYFYLAPLLDTSHFGGYDEDIMPRLFGVGSYDGKIAIQSFHQSKYKPKQTKRLKLWLYRPDLPLSTKWALRLHNN